ncbi:MAG: transketolase [Syntrophorhabdales bacterium]
MKNASNKRGLLREKVPLKYLEEKTEQVWRQTLMIHKIAQGTRLASSLSCIEIFVTLYYGKILSYDARDTFWEGRDRFIISKSHGAVSLYPILAELGWIDAGELERVCQQGGLLNDIPDSSIPGFETINGSLGHGLGVGCGVAKALKAKGRKEKVFVLSGDGELYEGSVWEAIMFGSHHMLDNLILIVDNNGISMLDYCDKIIKLEPLDRKFRAFGWKVRVVDGHNIGQLYEALNASKADAAKRPKVLIANTIKGRGVTRLEKDPLCHIKAVSGDEIDLLVGRNHG